jgi:membrane protein YqaA with SNARE-associated domain
MTGWTEMGFGLACLCCFALTIASAVFPWLSVEIIVLALPVVAHSRWALAVLVIIAVAGQMTGKCLVYWLSRKGARAASPKMTARLKRWRGRLTRGGSSPVAIVFLSSSVGFPPFFAITAIAGALKLNFAGFLAAGTAGRLVRFAALVVGTKVLGF